MTTDSYWNRQVVANSEYAANCIDTEERVSFMNSLAPAMKAAVEEQLRNLVNQIMAGGLPTTMTNVRYKSKECKSAE